LGKTQRIKRVTKGTDDTPVDMEDDSPVSVVENPTHYHKYKMDTFTFLENGFAPEVARGFYIGNVLKYIQRFELKNGLEDLEKAEKYLRTLIEHTQKTLK
jgi:hypothetical protein